MASAGGGVARGGRLVGDYMIGQQIGAGAFSTVWRARHRVRGTEVAVKEIAMDRLSNKLQENLLSEVFILRRINHPNIIALYDFIQVPYPSSFLYIYFSQRITRKGRILSQDLAINCQSPYQPS